MEETSSGPTREAKRIELSIDEVRKVREAMAMVQGTWTLLSLLPGSRRRCAEQDRVRQAAIAAGER